MPMQDIRGVSAHSVCHTGRVLAGLWTRDSFILAYLDKLTQKKEGILLIISPFYQQQAPWHAKECQGLVQMDSCDTLLGQAPATMSMYV